MSNENEFWALLGTQFGLATTWQAAECGVTKDQVRGWVRKGRLRRECYGIVSIAGIARTRGFLMMLGLLKAGPRRPELGTRAALCDLTAAELLDLVEIAENEPIHVMSTRRIQTPEQGFAFHWTSRLPEGELILVDGMAVTDPIRTFLDVCAQYPYRALSVYRRGLRKARFDKNRVLGRIDHESRQGRSGLVKAREVIESTDDTAGKAKSRLEDHFFDLLISMGYPPPQRNVKVAGKSGIVWEIDLYYQHVRKGLEISPVETHSDPLAVMRDQRKIGDLMLVGVLICSIGSDVSDQEFCRIARDLLGPPELFPR